MVNNPTNINKTNSHLSPKIIDHKRTTTDVYGNPELGVGQPQKKMAGLNQVM
jgi:hypothetical protein